jgi:hypothetical protein
VILDSDHEEVGIYAAEKGKIDKARSFAFMSELSNLYHLAIEMMLEIEFAKMSGWELWFRRLAHSYMLNLRESIPDDPT